MEEKSPAEKAAETRKRRNAAKKAVRTKRALKVAAGVKDSMYDKEKVDYLLGLNGGAIPDTCIVCGESKNQFLQVHHVDRERTKKVKLCANCHQLVGRGTLEDLKEAHERASR